MLLYIIIGIIVLILIYEFYKSYQRSDRRTTLYNQAVITAQLKNKKLLVIGDPDNGGHCKIFGREYGCGDLCLDLVGCKNCENSITAKVEDALPNFTDNSYVIFLSCVLEYVDKETLPLILEELKRVSGGDLFIVTIDPYTIASLFYPSRFFTGEPSVKRVITVPDIKKVRIEDMTISEL
jgi:hypothetical protein